MEKNNPVAGLETTMSEEEYKLFKRKTIYNIILMPFFYAFMNIAVYYEEGFNSASAVFMMAFTFLCLIPLWNNVLDYKYRQKVTILEHLQSVDDNEGYYIKTSLGSIKISVEQYEMNMYYIKTNCLFEIVFAKHSKICLTLQPRYENKGN